MLHMKKALRSLDRPSLELRRKHINTKFAKKSLESDVGGNKERHFKLNISSLFDENRKL